MTNLVTNMFADDFRL